MQITPAVRATVITEVIAELMSYGHHYAAGHVNSCRERLLARHAGECGHVVRDSTNTEAEDDATRQVAVTGQAASATGC